MTSKMREKKQDVEVMVTIKLLPSGPSISVPAGRTVSEALADSGIYLKSYCGGKGICGKCAVKILAGPESESRPTDREEASLLASRGLGTGWRLACRLVLAGDTALEIPDWSRMRIGASVLAPSRFVTDLSPAVKRLILPLGGRRAVIVRHKTEKAIGRALGIRTPEFASRDVFRRIRKILGTSAMAVLTIYRGRMVLDAYPSASGLGRSGPALDCLGLAVDLGTTTVAVELVDLLTGRVLGSAAALNAQFSYGADVVSRISYAFQDAERAARLQRAAASTIEALAAEAAGKACVSVRNIYEAVIAGNPPMNHILAGIGCDTLAVMPFAPAFKEHEPFPAVQAGLAFHPSAMVYLVPNIGGFVGGDITAGLTAVGLAGMAGNVLFLDLGTNGEIVVKRADGVCLAASTAMGPAFEGAALSCGMLAGPGAVASASWHDGLVTVTLDGSDPRGVCGTGLVDIVALSLEHGLLRADGRITAPEGVIALGGGLALDQRDIRKVQTSIGAVKAGICLVMEKAGLMIKDLDAIIVAGSFGASLDVGHAAAIGLLPRLSGSSRAEIRMAGNSSLAGSRLILLDERLRAAAALEASRIEHVSLAERLDFQEAFAAGLVLGPYKEMEK